MTTASAKKLINGKLVDWADKTIWFDALIDEDSKWAFVAINTMNYFGGKNFLKKEDVLKRAIANADAHKADGFETWAGHKIKVCK